MPGQGLKIVSVEIKYHIDIAVVSQLGPMKVNGPADWPTRVRCDLIGIDNLVGHARYPRLSKASAILPGRWGREGGRLRALLILMMSVDPPDVTKNMTTNLEGEDYGQAGSCARDTCRLIGLLTS